MPPSVLSLNCLLTEHPISNTSAVNMCADGVVYRKKIFCDEDMLALQSDIDLISEWVVLWPWCKRKQVEVPCNLNKKGAA